VLLRCVAATFASALAISASSLSTKWSTAAARRPEAKTARLREARLAKEAAKGLAHAPGEPAKAVKAKR